jgi:hypothetical protein
MPTRSLTILLCCLSCTVACAPEPYYYPPAPVPPQYPAVPGGVVLTQGVRIAAVDGSFVLTEAPFDSPFSQGASCVAAPSAENAHEGESTGARRVSVHLPAAEEGGEVILHGLLSLCGVPPTATGAATRRFGLQVPQEYVDATSGGRVSVVYEPFLDGAGTALQSKAWILWLSSTPFPGGTAPLGGSAAPVTGKGYESSVLGGDTM